MDSTLRPCVLSPPVPPSPHAGSRGWRGSPGLSPPSLGTHQRDTPCRALDTAAPPIGSTDTVLDRHLGNHEVPSAQCPGLGHPPHRWGLGQGSRLGEGQGLGALAGGVGWLHTQAAPGGE